MKTAQEIIKAHYRKIGAMGGRSGTGASKVRTTARKAALERWNRYRHEVEQAKQSGQSPQKEKVS